MRSESCKPVQRTKRGTDDSADHSPADNPAGGYRAEIVSDLAGIDPAAWDALAGAQPSSTPFLRHAFLHALHTSGCASEDSGWSPRYLMLWADGGDGSGSARLAAAMPLYAKSHSYGEYGFLCTMKVSDQLTE